MDLVWRAHGRLGQVGSVFEVLRGGLTSSPGWLRHAERIADRNGIESGYLTASLGGTVVAAIAHYLVENPADVSRSYRWSWRRAELSIHEYPRLYLGAFNGHLCEPAAAPSLSSRRLELLGSSAAHLAVMHPELPVAALYLPLPVSEEVPPGVTTLRGDAVLDTSHLSSLADHVAGLETKRRQNARRELRAALAVGGCSGLLQSVEPEVWAALLSAHARRFGRRLAPQAVQEEIESLQRSFGSDLVAFGYQHAGRLRAVSIGIVYQDTLYMKSFGIEPAYERQGLYSCLGYFEPIEWATSCGLEAISFGVNAARAKCLRGCRHRRLVGCAFDQLGDPTQLRAPAPPADEARHIEACPRQV